MANSYLKTPWSRNISKWRPFLKWPPLNGRHYRLEITVCYLKLHRSDRFFFFFVKLYVYELKEATFAQILLVFLILDNIYAKSEKKTCAVCYSLALL